MTALPAPEGGLRFGRLIGVGGIGSGLFFTLEGDHTLGRNESRLGTLTPNLDFCKLHIIAHYVAMLLGAREGRFAVDAIGRVGADTAGREMIERMRAAGINTAAVVTDSSAATLFSVCFQYPDSTGGNITTAGSASGLVTVEDIDRALRAIAADRPEMILAAPEVPVPTRLALLRAGRARGGFTAASVLAGEAAEFSAGQAWADIDLLALNIDEAAAIAGADAEARPGEEIAKACAAAVMAVNPRMRLAVTDGPRGSFIMEAGRFAHIPALAVRALGTGGAGDAYLAGTMAGLCCGLSFMPCEAGTLSGAAGLGTLLAAFSVTSPHTIHPGANAGALADFARDQGVKCAPDLAALLSGC